MPEGRHEHQNNPLMYCISRDHGHCHGHLMLVEFSVCVMEGEFSVCVMEGEFSVCVMEDEFSV